MTEQELLTTDWQTLLKGWIRNSEERFIWYKKELEDLYKLGIGRSDPGWMASLKDSKQWEEKNLARLREEQTNLKQGLNPPFCYPKKKS